jgi:uncharacterized protein (TIGR00251 family)
VQVRLRVIPNAQRDAVGGERGGALLVRVRAPAVDGKAAAAVLALVARAFEVRPRDVRLVHGEHNRDKVVEVAVEEQSGQTTLKALLGEAPGGVVR